MLDLLPPHVAVVWSADGLEFASNDEFEHHASIDGQQVSGVRPADERRGSGHVENLFADLRRPAAEMRAMKGQRPVW
jgi:hypothetical protein